MASRKRARKKRDEGGQTSGTPVENVMRSREESERRRQAIDGSIHWSLGITKASVAGLGLCAVAYLLWQLGSYLGVQAVSDVSAIAFTILFPVSSVLWFVSRHRAKVLTAARREHGE